MEIRVKGDLALLYGLRNKVVHAGVRTLPTRMAMYLTQLAAEMILTDMATTAEHLTAAAKLDPRCSATIRSPG
jgi:hypothetical protein